MNGMKRMKKITGILILFLLKASISVAQIDTAFWFAAPWVTPNHDQSGPIFLRLASFSNTTTVRVYQPAGAYTTTLTIAPNSLFNLDLTADTSIIQNSPANTILPNGLKISSDFPITAVYEVVTKNNLNPETYSLKGQNGLGLEFVTPF